MHFSAPTNGGIPMKWHSSTASFVWIFRKCQLLGAGKSSRTDGEMIGQVESGMAGNSSQSLVLRQRAHFFEDRLELIVFDKCQIDDRPLKTGAGSAFTVNKTAINKASD